MSRSFSHNPRHIVSQIDIELWAREQRRRWFARRFGALLRKLARMFARAVLLAHSRLVVCRRRGWRSTRTWCDDSLGPDRQARQFGASHCRRSSP
jgi:hypothetical protein